MQLCTSKYTERWLDKKIIRRYQLSSGLHFIYGCSKYILPYVVSCLLIHTCVHYVVVGSEYMLNIAPLIFRVSRRSSSWLVAFWSWRHIT